MAQGIMKKTVLVLLLSLMPLLNGCIFFAVGAAGAAGGYSISEDEIEGFTSQSYEKVWKEAYNAMIKNGVVHYQNQVLGKIEAQNGDSKITFHMVKMSEKQIRLRVKARKMSDMFPDLDLAKSVYGRLMKNLSPR